MMYLRLKRDKTFYSTLLLNRGTKIGLLVLGYIYISSNFDNLR